MPAAIAIPLIIGAASAGTAVIGAKMQSNAVNKAARLQTASADKAQGFNQQVYNDQRHDLQPYVAGGQSAFNQLLSVWQAKQPGGVPAPYRPPQAPVQAASPFGQAMTPQVAGMPPQGAQGPQMPQGGAVQLKAPDGTVSSVPSQLADQFIAKGAVRV